MTEINYEGNIDYTKESNIVFPDSKKLYLGRRFRIINILSNKVYIKDYNNNIIGEFPSKSHGLCYVVSDSYEEKKNWSWGIIGNKFENPELLEGLK